MMDATETIIKVSRLIADKVEVENIKGACDRMPHILKYYLNRYHKIDIDLHYGLVECGGMYGLHTWNSYQGKMIDITIHNQLLDETCSNCIILDEVHISKQGKIVYHLNGILPQDYLEKIKSAADDEKKLKSIPNRSIEQEQQRIMLAEILDTDATLVRAERTNMEDLSMVRGYLKNHYKKEMNEVFAHLKAGIAS